MQHRSVAQLTIHRTFTTLGSTLQTASSLHSDILSFYDIPSISLRDALLPRILADPDGEMPKWFRTGSGIPITDPKVGEYGGQAVDLMHVSARVLAFGWARHRTRDC